MNGLIAELEIEFRKNANPLTAKGQKAYMKNNFEFFGIKSPLRRDIQKPFFQKEFLPHKYEIEGIVKELWSKPQRDFQYFAQELLFRYAKEFDSKDIDLLEFMVVHKSWWDSIDFIAPKLIGAYFKRYPEYRNGTVERWMKSDSIWLQRSSILFQLKYKQELDTDFLAYVINNLNGSKEFFVNKAIGWILRDYSRIDAKWVSDFCKNSSLSNLSRREALRLNLYPNS